MPKGARPSRRYVANVLWQSDGPNKGKVVAMKLTKKTATNLLNKAEKYGTMMDRDYELARYGEGTDTEYDVTPEAPSKVNTAKLELIDLVGKIVEEYERATGIAADTDSDDDEKPAAKGKRTVKKQTRGDEEEADGPDFNALGEAGDEGNRKAIATLTEMAEAADLDPDDYETWTDLAEALAEAEPEAEEAEEAEEESDDEEEGIDIDEVAAAADDDGDTDAIEALTALAEENDLDPDDYGTWAELAEAIKEAAGEGEEEEVETYEEAEEAEEAEDELDVDAINEAATKADKGGRGSDAAIEYLNGIAAIAELDPDEYESWADLAEAIIEAAGGEEEEEEGEVTEIDLDTLNGMSLDKLRTFADEYEIEHKGLTKKALIQAIVAAAEE